MPSALTHYWSLAVEEQFCFEWPASVLVMWKVATRFRRRNPLGVLFAATAVFVAASALASVVFASSSISYYGTHTRAYQLISGGVIVHRDDNHLSATFVRDHTAAFAAMLAKVGITF